MAANRGKRSVAVDVTDPRGLAVVQRLAATADVVVENFLPGAAARLGLDRETLVGARPEVVYCSITGYPADSPNAHRPGYDFAIQGDGGIMSVTGDVDGDPMKVGVAVADITSGMFAASGILAAIIEARATGRAPAVAVSLFGSQIAWLGNRATEVLVAGIEPERFGNAHPSLVPYETFRAADGFVNLAVGSDVQFRSFCTEAGALELADDPRYATNAGRVAERAELVPRLQELFATRTVAEWIARVRPRPRARRPDPHRPRGRGRLAVGDRRPRARHGGHGAHVPLADRHRRRAPDGALRSAHPGPAHRRGPARARLRRRRARRTAGRPLPARADARRCGAIADLRATCVECSTRGHPSRGATVRPRSSPTGPTRRRWSLRSRPSAASRRWSSPARPALSRRRSATLPRAARS